MESELVKIRPSQTHDPCDYEYVTIVMVVIVIIMYHSPGLLDLSFGCKHVIIVSSYFIPHIIHHAKSNPICSIYSMTYLPT